MEFKHSAVEMRYALFPDTPWAENPDIDAHLAEWAAEGYELVSVTERFRDGGRYIEDTFTFFWRRST